MDEHVMGWRAGTASAVITPEESLWLAGWASRKEPARGTLSELRATAVALEDEGGTRLVLIGVDLIGVPKWLSDSVAAALPRAHLVIAASHTHCGPEIRPDKALFFGIPEEFAAKIIPAAQRVRDQLIHVAKEAFGKLEPATITAHRGSSDIAVNRRKGASDVDHDVPVLAAHDSAGAMRAIVFGYACHNLVLPPEDLRYSGDFVGDARTLVEGRFGCEAVFMTGCAADQDPVPRGSVELMREHGEELAAAVEDAIGREGVAVGARLRVASEDVTLEMQPVTRRWIEQGLASDDPPLRRKAHYLARYAQMHGGFDLVYPMPMQAVRLGDEVLMLTLGGEPVAEWSLRFRERFRFPIVWTAGYCNDLCGYLPTVRIQREGGYEGGRAMLWSALPGPWAEDVEERVEAAAARLVEKVSQ